MLVGFHGYGEGAETQLERMRAIPGADRWLLVSIQGLHRFYQRRTNEVVASWMTRQDRELAIADNLAYVAAVIDAVEREYPGAPRLVLTGFSQGVAMTFRAAAASLAAGGRRHRGRRRRAARARRRCGRWRESRRALVCRGARDEWYTTAISTRDVAAAARRGRRPSRPLEFDGGHEWSDEVVQAASSFLASGWP